MGSPEDVRRRRVVAATAAMGVGVLGASLSTRPGSPAFYALTGATALTWTVGGLAAGPLHRGWTAPRTGRTATQAAATRAAAQSTQAADRSAGLTADPPPTHTPAQSATPTPTAGRRRPVLGPVLIGVGAFGAFYAAALVARRIPPLNRAIASVLRFADAGAERGAGGLVLATTLVNGAAEEVFFRGALYDAAGRGAVPVSTAGYVLATTATRNPALVLASAAMGVLFARQRHATGGIQAPLLTHVTWSALMLRFLPPLFRDARP